MASLTWLIAVAIVMVPCARPADAQGTETGERVEPCAIAPPALQIAAVLEPSCARCVIDRRRFEDS